MNMDWKYKIIREKEYNDGRAAFTNLKILNIFLTYFSNIEKTEKTVQ